MTVNTYYYVELRSNQSMGDIILPDRRQVYFYVEFRSYLSEGERLGRLLDNSIGRVVSKLSNTSLFAFF